MKTTSPRTGLVASDLAFLAAEQGTDDLAYARRERAAVLGVHPRTITRGLRRLAAEGRIAYRPGVGHAPSKVKIIHL